MRLASEAQKTEPGLTASDQQSLKQRDPDNNKADKPKAYLNYVFFDKQFKFVGDGSGVKQVDDEPGELQTLTSGKVVAKKNGYVYVYTSNESQQDVLFDNFGVEQISGPVLEETHYYPYGLTMAGISTIAPLKLANNYKYNSKELNHNEFSDGTGLEWYSYGDREYDPQIGTFHALDPYPEIAAGISPYSYAFDNPVLFMDINGDSTVPVGDVKGDWSNFDTQNNSIGLNAVTVTGHRSYYGSYDPLYTGLSMEPLGVRHVSEGVHTLNGQRHSGLKEFDPSKTIKTDYNLFTSAGVKMDYYHSKVIRNGTSPVELIINPLTKQEISTSYHLETGTYNIGMDGSVSYGNEFISFGIAPDNVWTLDLSLPAPFHSSVGTTIYYDPRVFIKNLKYFGEGLDKMISAIYYTMPLSAPSPQQIPIPVY